MTPGASKLEGRELCLQHGRDEARVVADRGLPGHLVVRIAHDAHQQPKATQIYIYRSMTRAISSSSFLKPI